MLKSEMVADVRRGRCHILPSAVMCLWPRLADRRHSQLFSQDIALGNELESCRKNLRLIEVGITLVPKVIAEKFCEIYGYAASLPAKMAGW